ncbi:hypothetical protein [Helicobacter sp. UBA3407]|uniref:hypothetical protein n=1 Tax=Helicobacter TaxID=209 RepID=UPI0026115B92|nr:hypothetical protein [Helicobacter sp. UBA3407]
MKLKALSLALAQTLLPTFSKEQTQTKRGNPTKRSQTSTISKNERKRRTKHKKTIKKQNAKGKK